MTDKVGSGDVEKGDEKDDRLELNLIRYYTKGHFEGVTQGAMFKVRGELLNVRHQSRGEARRVT